MENVNFYLIGDSFWWYCRQNLLPRFCSTLNKNHWSILVVFALIYSFPAWSRCHVNWWHKIKSHEGIVQKIQAKQQFQHNNRLVWKSRGNFVKSCGTLANFAKTFCSGSSGRCYWDWWFSGKENQWSIPTLLKIHSICQIHSVEINYEY